MEDYIKIGKRICELRNEKGLTQDDLAELLNIDKRKISRIECGTSIPDIDVLIKLSHLFDTSIDYLVFNTNSKKRHS